MPSGDPTVVDGKLCRTSPSSIEQLDRCETNWWLNYVGHIEEKVHPTTAFGQRVGQGAHTQLENKMLKSAPLTDPFARALAKYLPPVGPGLLVETATTGLLAAGVPVKGRIDWTHGYMPKRPIVADWKTRKDLKKYQKTEEELRADIQMNAYARWAIDYYEEAESIDVAHYYVETKHHVKKDPDGRLYIFDPGFEPATDRLLLNFSIDETKSFWSNTVEPLVERMKAVAATPAHLIHTLGHPEDMNARDSACNMFGGCPRKHACPHSPMNQLRARMAAASSNQEQKPMGLADLLKQHSAAAAPASASTPPPPDEGVVPPDAGRRTNPVKVEAPAPAPAPAPELVAEQKKLEEVAANHVDARTPEAQALDAQANATGHTHKYDQTIDGKAACACGRKKPGRSAATPKPVETAETAVATDPAKADPPAAQKTIDAAQNDIDKAIAAARARDAEQAKINREALAEIEQKEKEEQAAKEKAEQERVAKRDAELANPFRLYIGCASNLPCTDLTKYAHDAATKVANAGGAKDPRFVLDKNNVLAYGAWKGALSEYVRDNPPTGRCVIYPVGDEIAEVVTSALAPVAVEVIRRG